MKYTNKVSGGYIKDLAVISFVGALLKISKDPEENMSGYDPENSGIVDAAFTFYSEEEEQMVSDILDDIYDKIWAIMSDPINDHKVKARVQAGINRLMNRSMRILIKKSVSLDTLALFVLWNNFIKRTTPMHENFKSLVEYQDMMTVVMDTFDTAGQSLITKVQMNSIAKEIIMEVS